MLLHIKQIGVCSVDALLVLHSQSDHFCKFPQVKTSDMRCDKFLYTAGRYALAIMCCFLTQTSPYLMTTYKYFKQPPFKDLVVINQEEHANAANGGVLYVQVGSCMYR